MQDSSATFASPEFGLEMIYVSLGDGGERATAAAELGALGTESRQLLHQGGYGYRYRLIPLSSTGSIRSRHFLA